MSYLKSLSLKPITTLLQGRKSDGRPMQWEKTREDAADLRSASHAVWVVSNNGPMEGAPTGTEADRLLSLSLLFSCLLAIVRVIHTGRLTFLFLIWNLFLAWVPYLISGWLSGRRGRNNRSAVVVIFSLVWLVTIPNAFYILTDLYHLGDGYNDRQVPQWYDLIMILSFAWNGLSLGVLSVRQMEKIWVRAQNELLFVYPVMWLNALGVYTGRYLRYNSWEIVSNPFRLLADIAGMVIHPLRNQTAWDMIFCFSILMTLMYLMMKRISKTLA